MRYIAGVIFVLLSLAAGPGLSSVFAQTSARLTGRVLDPSGAAVAGATVSAHNTGTGYRRRAATDGEGVYLLPELPVGDYDVTTTKDGFQPAACSPLHLGVGETVVVDFQLAIGPVTETITVAAETPAIEADASRGGTLLNRQIVGLPINGRDYARFSQLAPGAVARTNSIADLSFNGLHTVHNQFTIDGVNATRVDQAYMANGYERGARLLTGSLETIQEFRIHTANYQAQFGRAAGSFINIATRSGSNQIHGGVLEFLRNDAFDARNFFNTMPAPQAKFRFNNFGVSLGGPVRKDRAFFFTNYEGSRQGIGITGSGTTPSSLLRQQVLERSPELAPIVANFPIGTSPGVNPLVDDYRAVSVSGVREDTGSVKIDYIFAERDFTYARVNLNDTRVSGPLFGVSPSALGVSDYQIVPIRTSNAALQHQHIFSQTFLSETLLGMQRWGSTIITDSPYPLVSIAGLTIAPGSRGRTISNNTSYQVGNTMSLVRGGHNLKWGLSAYRVQIDRRGTDATVIFITSLKDFIANSASMVAYIAGDPGSATRAVETGAFFQDTWRLSSRLTLDYGLRHDYGTPPYDPSRRAQSFDSRTGTLAAPGAPYFKSNKGNWGPRLALAWQLSSRLGLRTGFGVFVQPYPVGYGAYSVPVNNLRRSTTLLRAEIPELGYPVDRFLSKGTASIPAVTGFDWIKPDAQSRQWNLTLDWEIVQGSLLQAAYVGTHGANLRRNIDVNLFDPRLGRRPNPNFSSITLETATGRSDYHALQLSLKRRYASSLHFGVNYTFSHAIDDVQDQGLFSAQPQDKNNLRAERGNGSGDIRHAVQYNVLYSLPFARSNRWLGGWQIATLGILHTGVATTVFIGQNTSGDGNLTNQRPNAVYGASVYPADRTIDRWLNVTAFSMPLPRTFGNLGRNTVVAPGLAQLDIALLKDIRVRGDAYFQFRAEVFNAPNHPSFAPPDTTLGSATFGRSLNTLGRTLGMGTSRQIQLGMKAVF